MYRTPHPREKDLWTFHGVLLWAQWAAEPRRIQFVQRLLPLRREGSFHSTQAECGVSDVPSWRKHQNKGGDSCFGFHTAATLFTQTPGGLADVWPRIIASTKPPSWLGSAGVLLETRTSAGRHTPNHVFEAFNSTMWPGSSSADESSQTSCTHVPCVNFLTTLWTAIISSAHADNPRTILRPSGFV